jgi:hypothetical protein
MGKGGKYFCVLESHTVKKYMGLEIYLGRLLTPVPDVVSF